MDPSLAEKYPRAKKAFETQDIFYSRIGEPTPKSLSKNRARLASLIDTYIDGSPEEKEAFIIAGAISLEPFSGAKMYGDPDYGTLLDGVMIELIEAAKKPEAPVSPRLAPLVTATMIAKMEQTIDDVEAGVQQVNDRALKGSMKRAAINDEIALTNLRNKPLRDLYELTQFIYFGALERANTRAKNIPPPLNPKL